MEKRVRNEVGTATPLGIDFLDLSLAFLPSWWPTWLSKATQEASKTVLKTMCFSKAS